MTRVSDGTNVPISPAPASSSNMGSPDGALPDLEATGFRANTEQINELYLQLPLYIQNAARIENCVQTLAQTVAAKTTKITSIEHVVGSLVARVTSLETNAASGSSSLTQRDPGTYSDEVTAPQPLGPMALDHPMTTEIQDVDLIPLQALMTNKHAVPFYYDAHASNASLELRSGSITFGKNLSFQHITGQSESTVKQVPCRPDSFLKQEPSVKNSWLGIKMVASHMRSTPFCVLPKQLSWFAIPSQSKTEKPESNYAPLESCCRRTPNSLPGWRRQRLVCCSST